MATKPDRSKSGILRALLKPRRRPWTILALAVILGGGGWGGYSATKRVTVETAIAVRGPAVEAVYATGVVEPVHWAKVAPTIVGRIAEIKARDGDTVKRDDALLRLDDREAKAELARLEARRKFTGEELQRYERLARSSIASQQAYERARSEHIQALAQVAAARQRLNDYTLYAPLDGTVLRQDGEVGETVTAGQVLFWVGKRTPLRIVADVDEEDIPLVQIGQTVLISADAFGGRVFKGKIDEITPKGDPVNKNYRVRVSLPESTPLHIGMTTEVNVVIRRTDNALLVPYEAVQKGTVWVVTNGRVEQRKVKTGIVGAQQIQILEGLKDGEVVVAKPPGDLAPGARVKTTAAKTKA